jgi:hypothetical protein
MLKYLVLLLFASPALAGWKYELIADPFTDKKTASATWTDGGGVAAVICEQGQLNVLFGFGRKIGDNGQSKAMMVRFDSEEVQIKEWITNDEGVFVALAGSQESVHQFIESMYWSRKLAVRIVDADGRNATYIYPISSAPGPIENTMVACGVTPPEG